jgi:hypothetical protein
MDVKVEPLDKTRRVGAYDDVEPDWNLKIAVPMGKPAFAFTFNEIYKSPFVKLKDVLGEAAFDKIVEEQGYRVPKGEFETWVGTDKLPLYFYVRPDEKEGAVKLLLVSMGEYQPGRYMAHVEGIWRVTGSQL